MGNTSIRPSSGQVQKSLIISGIIFCLFSNIFAYSGGTGTEADPYQIATKADLLQLAATTADYGKCFILINDIDMAGQVFAKAIIATDTVAGGYTFEGTAFTGLFNGNGQKITNFTIKSGALYDYIGLFGYVGSGSQICNLGIENVSITGHFYVGGLAGYNKGTIISCYSTGKVTGYCEVGGLVGYNYSGSISNCYSTGVVSSSSQRAGGLVGWNYKGNITGCYATGAVTGDRFVGGLAGISEGSISDCYATGTVRGSWCVGGLAGVHYNGSIRNCYSTGTVLASSGSYYVGGLVGVNNSSISNCYSTGGVSGGSFNVGGLVGDNSGCVSDCYATGTVSGGDSVGGLVGYNYYGGSTRNPSDSIRQCYSTGVVNGKSYVGGLVGFNRKGTVTISFWDIETSGRTTSYGGTGKTTAQMHSIDTFLSWGCVDEEWTINDGNDYPRLVWENLPGQLIALTLVYGGGFGTAEEPFLIYTPKQLNTIGLVDCAMNKHFKLMSDIDLSCFPGDQFNIIGSQRFPFNGVFDGNGYVITNLTIDARESSYIGLFGCIGPDGVITNLGIEDVNIFGDSSVGGLVGYNHGNINACYATGAVDGRYGVGGLVGDNDGSINDCYATDIITGSENIGGLVGANNSGSIRNCYSTGAVAGDGSVGGLIGGNIDPYKITASFWDVETSGQTTSAGGEGKTTAEMYLVETFSPWGCDDTWTIDDGNDYPRLVWQGLPGQFIPTPVYGGGLGTAEEPFLIYTPQQLNTIGITPCHMDMHFKLMSDIDLSCFPDNRFNIIGKGGFPFTGVFDGNGYTILNLTIDANESDYIGLFGYTGPNSRIINLGVEDVNVFGRYYIGGLAGQNNGSISNCYSTGTVSGSSYIGGLVGYSYRSSISSCYSTETVSGVDRVGGLVGENYRSSISNCYSTGEVSGSSYVGGLVGRNYGSSISNCYSAGMVSGSSSVGGLVGYRSGGSVNNSFWDVNTSGQTTSAGGTGKTTAQMQDINTFLAAGWDFAGETANGTDDIWTICDGFTYPKFVYQNAQPIADAGPNQTVYAWLDGIAEVELDGSASSDADECNGLSYHWTWTIDDNTYEEANGVNPVIELPSGVHTIELIVNDGLADSEPNYVEINVIAPLKTDLQIMPTVVNRASNIRNIIAVMDMPKGIKRGDISKEPFVLFPADGEEGIEAVRQYVLPCWRHRIRVVALFDKDDLIDLIPNNGKVKLQVIGELNSGQYIFGEDSIRIIGKRPPFWWRWRK